MDEQGVDLATSSLLDATSTGTASSIISTVPLLPHDLECYIELEDRWSVEIWILFPLAWICLLDSFQWCQDIPGKCKWAPIQVEVLSASLIFQIRISKWKLCISVHAFNRHVQFCFYFLKAPLIVSCVELFPVVYWSLLKNRICRFHFVYVGFNILACPNLLVTKSSNVVVGLLFLWEGWKDMVKRSQIFARNCVGCWLRSYLECMNTLDEIMDISGICQVGILRCSLLIHISIWSHLWCYAN